MATVKELRRIARATQLKFTRPRAMVKEWFQKREIEIQSEIWIYPLYPTKFKAIVAAYDRAWIFTGYNGHLELTDVQIIYGFNPNGTLILKGE